MSQRLLVCLLGPLLLLGLACNLSPVASTTPPPVATEPPATATPAPQIPPTASPLPPDSGWRALGMGLDHRVKRWFNTSDQVIEIMHILRLDPAGFDFRVAYAPGEPISVKEWAARSGSLITLNAGYFTPDYMATGLLIADNIPFGVSYEGFGGMMAVGPAGVEIRSLETEPYDPSEPLTAAVQSFPMLVKPGGTLGYPEEDGLPSRRAVIGKDRQGKILVILCPVGAFTLHSLALELLDSDLDLDVALNLDGGTSAGLWVTSNDIEIKIPSLTAVPAVILIDPRR